MSKMQQPILCISAKKLFEKGKWNGLKKDNLEDYYNLLEKESEFKIRTELEIDPNYKQIIPQVILTHNGKYFLHRQVSANEKRLNSLCPLPLGGHIEEFDVVEGRSVIEQALQRELQEEARMNANITKREFLGLIYIEDENPVNAVHIGLLYLFHIDSDDVVMIDEGLETVGWVDEKYLKSHIDELTYWSRVFVSEYF